MAAERGEAEKEVESVVVMEVAVLSVVE